MGLFRKGKIRIIAKFRTTYLVIFRQSRAGKTPSYSRINMVRVNGILSEDQLYHLIFALPPLSICLINVISLDRGKFENKILNSVSAGAWEEVCVQVCL